MADEGGLIAERYRVGERVGQGAMGVVWQAEDERLRRVVALKQVSLPAGADDRAREQAHRRVFREARMIARLHHPHAIGVYDVVEHEGRPWLVMEYLPSRSLAEVLVAEGPLAPDRVARVGRQVADALAAAHEAGIVHRDVKPGNVLLGDDGLVKVTDFGIARAVDDVTLTSTGMMAGTPAYLAPEVARGGTADFRSDVFSLGSTLYAALEGMPPFGTGDNPLAVLHRVASGEHAPPAHRGPITPLVEHLLRPEPERRPNMDQARGDLARLILAEAGTEEGPVTPFLARPEAAADLPADARPTPPVAPPPRPPPAPPPAPAGAAAAPAAAAPAAGAPAAVSTGAEAPSGAGRTGRPGAEASPDTAGARVTRPVTGPVTTTPVNVSDRSAGDESHSPRGSGPRWPWFAAAGVVVALVAVIVLAAVLGTTGSSPGASIPGSTAAPETDGGNEPTPGGGAGTDSPDTSGALSGSPEDQARQQAVVDYYGLLPDQLDQGWQRLTPSFQASTAGGFEDYRGFWGTMQQVTVRGVSPTGDDEVDATVTYRYRDGREVDERTVFRLVSQDGTWKIDGQRQASG